MGMGINSAGVGFGNNSNINWPAGAKAPKEESSFSLKREGVAEAKPAESTGAAEATGATTQAGQAGKAAETSSVARPQTWQVTVADLVQQLIQQNVPNTQLNKNAALLMMKYGVELSSSNFEKLGQLLKGRTDPNSVESAVVSLSKGLGESSRSVDFLQGFLAGTTQPAAQIENLQMAIRQMSAVLVADRVLDPGIIAGLNSILVSFDDELKKLLKRASGDTLSLEKFNRNELIMDSYTLNQFLVGIEQKYDGVELPAETRAALQSLKQSLQDVLGQFSGQGILSKSSEKQPLGVMENYAYWQIPNMMSEMPGSIDILVKKDPSKKGTAIDPEKTKLWVRLDTPDLGEITISVVVVDKKLWYTFNSEHEATSKMVSSFQVELRDRMAEAGFELAGFQSVRKKIDIKKFMLPTQNLDNLMRVSAEA